MKELYLGRTQLGNDGLAQLCNGGSWPNLTALSLAQNGLDDKSAHMLAETKLFPKLITLDLYNNNISDEAVDAIRCSPHLKCLRILQFN
jgi:Leucine-rich repeat (LRR) protein